MSVPWQQVLLIFWAGFKVKSQIGNKVSSFGKFDTNFISRGKKRYQVLWESVRKGWLVLVVFFPSHLMTQLIAHSDVLLALGQVLFARRPDDKVFIQGGRSPTLLLLVFSWGAWHSCLLSPRGDGRLTLLAFLAEGRQALLTDKSLLLSRNYSPSAPAWGSNCQNLWTRVLVSAKGRLLISSCLPTCEIGILPWWSMTKTLSSQGRGPGFSPWSGE